MLDRRSFIFNPPTRSGQSLVELIVGIAIAVIFVVGAATVIAPSLQINKQTTIVQTKTELATELLDNVKAWAGGNWNNVLALATGTANTYYLSTATSSFTVLASATTQIVTEPSTVTFDAIASTTVTSATSTSWTHVVTSTGSNLILIAGVGTGANMSARTFSATYGGVSMTSIGTSSPSGGPVNGMVQLFYLIAPPTGSNAVKIVASGNAKIRLMVGSLSFTGAAQSAPIHSVNPTSGDDASPSSTVASAAGDMVVDIACTGTGFIGSGQTLRWMENIDGANYCDNTAQSTAAGAASVNMNYSVNADSWAMIGADIGAGTTTSSVQGSMGGVTEYITIGSSSYNRYFYLSDVYRDSNGNVTTTAIGNNYDPSTKLVTVVVQASSTPSTPALTTSFYLTRNGSTNFNQTSWSGGSGQNTALTIVGTNYASSSNITISASGTIQLATGGGSCVL
jgi:hypothetical protein